MGFFPESYYLIILIAADSRGENNVALQSMIIGERAKQSRQYQE